MARVIIYPFWFVSSHVLVAAPTIKRQSRKHHHLFAIPQLNLHRGQQFKKKGSPSTLVLVLAGILFCFLDELLMFACWPIYCRRRTEEGRCCPSVTQLGPLSLLDGLFPGNMPSLRWHHPQHISSVSSSTSDQIGADRNAFLLLSLSCSFLSPAIIRSICSLVMVRA